MKGITLARIEAYAARAVELAFEGTACDPNDEDDVNYYDSLRAKQQREHAFFEKVLAPCRKKES